MSSVSTFTDRAAPAPRKADTLPFVLAPIGIGDPALLAAGTSFAAGAPARAKNDAETVFALAEFLSELISSKTSPAQLPEKLLAALHDFAKLNMTTQDAVRDPALLIPLLVANAIAAGVHSNLIDANHGNRPFTATRFAAAIFEQAEMGQSRRQIQRVLVAAKRWLLFYQGGFAPPASLDVVSALEDVGPDEEALAVYVSVTQELRRAPYSRDELLAVRAGLTPGKDKPKAKKKEPRMVAVPATPQRHWRFEILNRLDSERPVLQAGEPPDGCREEVQRKAVAVGTAARSGIIERLRELNAETSPVECLNPHYFLKIFPTYFEIKAAPATASVQLQRADKRLAAISFHAVAAGEWMQSVVRLNASERNAHEFRARQCVRQLNAQSPLIAATTPGAAPDGNEEARPAAVSTEQELK